jgi:hypothetical protein
MDNSYQMPNCDIDFRDLFRGYAYKQMTYILRNKDVLFKREKNTHPSTAYIGG